MNDEVKLWLEILTQGRIAIAPDQAHAILWLAIGNAALSLERAIRAAAPAPVASAPTKPGLAKTKPTKTKPTKPAGRHRSPKSIASQVLHVVKASPTTTYAQLRAALGGTPAARIYRACDQLVQRGAITRTRANGEVRLAAR